MDQAPALTMSDRTAPPSRMPTPGPEALAAAASGDGKSADPSENAAASSSAVPSLADAPAAAPGSPDATRNSTDTITEGTQRMAAHGLYQGSLEEEVGQVMGTLNSFWGSFKKQGATAFSSLKKEADRTVQQVQEDFKYLQATKVEVAAKDQATWDAEQAAEREKRTAKDKGKGRETAGGEGEGATDAGAGGPDFIARLTSSTTQLQQSIQSSLATTLAAAKANPALTNPAQLRAQLAENLRLSSARDNLQLSLAQAEKIAEAYLKRGEAGLHQAEKLAGDYLKRGEKWVEDAEKWVAENVRVVAPEGDAGAQYVSLGWDGTDFYSFSTSTAAAGSQVTSPVLFDAGSGAGRTRITSTALAGSRKEALLRRLREDQSLLLVDPAGEEETAERREAFAKWVKDDFEKAIAAEKATEEGLVGTVRMALDVQFWQRYLFHKHMLESEESRRKALLQATESQQDDFSWDDEDESPVAPKETTPKATTPVPTAQPTSAVAAAPTPAPGSATAKLPPSTGTSPRDSEESYDLVSDQGGKRAPVPAASTAQDEDEDSDWE